MDLFLQQIVDSVPWFRLTSIVCLARHISWTRIMTQRIEELKTLMDRENNVRAAYRFRLILALSAFFTVIFNYTFSFAVIVLHGQDATDKQSVLINASYMLVSWYGMKVLALAALYSVFTCSTTFIIYGHRINTFLWVMVTVILNIYRIDQTVPVLTPQLFTHQ